MTSFYLSCVLECDDTTSQRETHTNLGLALDAAAALGPQGRVYVADLPNRSVRLMSPTDLAMKLDKEAIATAAIRGERWARRALEQEHERKLRESGTVLYAIIGHERVKGVLKPMLLLGSSFHLSGAEDGAKRLAEAGRCEKIVIYGVNLGEAEVLSECYACKA